MIALLLAALLITLLGAWGLVALLGLATVAYLALCALPAVPLLVWYWRRPEGRVARDYIDRLHAYAEGRGPMPPEGLP